MKKHISLLGLIFLALTADAQYAQQNISLLGHWFNPAQVAEPSHGIKYNGVWGWVDTDGKEYAILGSGTGTHIIDVSNPALPVEKDFVPGRRDLCVWREFKTFGSYLYAVSDDGAPNSLQIIDLSYLPDSVHVVHDDVSIFQRAHTIFVEGDKLYCASVTTTTGYYSMAVYGLADPENPVLLRTLGQDDASIANVHDMLVRNDTVYASCGYQGLFIYTYNAGTNNFSLINSVTSYPLAGYNHSSAITPDGKTLIFCDEVPDNRPVHLLDITDINNIGFPSTFKSNEGATPHNPYIYGDNKAVIAYYQDGLQIFNIDDPNWPYRTGYFDTDTIHGLNDGYTGHTYHGAWGAYIDLPSGNFLVSDMQNGLYVLDVSVAVGITEHPSGGQVYGLYPNPASSELQIALHLQHDTDLSCRIYDVTGRLMQQTALAAATGDQSIRLDLASFPAGLYLLKISGEGIEHSSKFIRK